MPQPYSFPLINMYSFLCFFFFLFSNGHLDVVRFLVDGGHCQLNSKDNHGETALHWAARYVHQSVYYSYNRVSFRIFVKRGQT